MRIKRDQEHRKTLHDFYNSAAWRKCREAYAKEKCYICERCGAIDEKPAVHHKIYLNANNYKNPEVALNHNNLILLCRSCHNKEHGNGQKVKRYIVGVDGEIILLNNDNQLKQIDGQY